MLFNSFAGKVLTANPAGKSVTLEQVPLEQPADVSQAAIIEPQKVQLWTYHDGVIVSAADKMLALASDGSGYLYLTNLGSKALPSQHWGMAGMYLLHRDGRDQVATFHEKDQKLKMSGDC